ncbi:GDSL esterase/lipase [Platanthera zijinensis]|uniref:GDSL esterase/lipase n=1 Tax=Platanthera zijinensis TaxID=2320716 RepID=A0AAP0AZG1_9ASPA
MGSNDYLMPNYNTRNIHNSDLFSTLLVQQYTLQLGFKVINNGCCGFGRNLGQTTRLPFQTPCPNRAEYVFWDAFHPTEKVNAILVTRAFNGSGDAVILIIIQLLAIAEPLSWKEEGGGKTKKRVAAIQKLGCGKHFGLRIFD